MTIEGSRTSPLSSPPSFGVLSRRALLQVSGGVGLALFLGACRGGETDHQGSGSGEPQRGGALTWALEADPATLAPFGVGNTSSQQVKNLVYESLVGWDKNLNIVPALAERWETPDDKTYIFHLRKNVQFHSGKEFDAEDVKYSFEKQQNPPPPGNVTTFYPKIDSIEVVDRHTVKFKMSQSDGTVLGYCAWLAYSFVVPKGLYDSTDTRSDADGTGPFRLDKYVPNDRLALLRNKDYWNAQRPYLDSLTLKILPDLQSRLTALRSGTVDGATITSDTVATFEKDANVSVLSGPSAAFREIEFTIKGDGQPWDDVRVRQAINLAVDRDEIVEKVYGGEAEWSSKIPPSYGNWPISDDELRSTYERPDVDKAKELMEEAGYSDGFSVTLQAISSPDDYVQIAEVLKAQLKKVNIDVTVQPLEIGTFAKFNTSGDFEWQSTARGMRGDPSGYFSDFDPAGSTYKIWFEGGYENEQLSDLVYQGIAETDQGVRKDLYTQMQKIVLTEWPTLPLVSPVKFEAVRRRVHDMVVSVDDTYRGLADVWVTS